MYDLAHFSAVDTIATREAITRIGNESKTLEDAAQGIVRYLHGNLGDKKTAQGACALVRFYKTHPYGDLAPELQAFARSILGSTPHSPTLQCLTLLATAGNRPEWNNRKLSSGHKAIPLSSVDFVKQTPMVAQLITQLGLTIQNVLAPKPDLMVDSAQREYNVFHVPKALGSPFIPAQQEFVIPQRIESVIGFGGLLDSGDMVAVIAFCQVAVSKDVAGYFRPMGPAIMTIADRFVRRGAVFAN